MKLSEFRYVSIYVMGSSLMQENEDYWAPFYLENEYFIVLIERTNVVL
jgi:hypothetical protein